jgi:hypothetical protein
MVSPRGLRVGVNANTLGRGGARRRVVTVVPTLPLTRCGVDGRDRRMTLLLGGQYVAIRNGKGWLWAYMWRRPTLRAAFEVLCKDGVVVE